MNGKFINLRQRLVTALTLVLSFLFILPFFLTLPSQKRAVAEEDDLIAIHAYDVEMTIEEDRQVSVHERVTVEFLQHGLTMFYRSFPIENARFYDISATCEGNDEFVYRVEDNPYMDDFFDLNLVGGAQKGKVWTYEIFFKMENGLGAASKNDGMIIDVVPFGSTVPYYNVTATVHFPYRVTEDTFALYKGYSSNTPAADLNASLSDDGKTLCFSADKLSLAYNSEFGERVVQGVTLDFTMDGTFSGYVKTRIFTGGMWKILLGGVAVIAIAVVIRMLCRKKRDVVTVVNFTAPDSLDPMQMGKILDGVVDGEDVTSIIYYFADKGYLSIDLSNQDEPVLIKKTASLPSDTPTHVKTLFNGLFQSGERVTAKDLQYKFCNVVDKAKLQTRKVKMYDKKSAIGYVLGGVVGVLFATLSLLIAGTLRLGNDYAYGVGVVTFVPVLVHLLLGYIRENYRFKWKKGKTRVLTCVIAVIEIFFGLVFVFGMAKHILTEFEKLLIILCAYACVYVTQDTLSRREDYVERLGEILGFKDFIVHTEEDKIKFMLEENPELYYKILPYAQVLGVTDEWEKKFENILLQPPSWYVGPRMTTFDYYIINRSMTRSLVTAMARPQPKGGSSIGRSGGGGSFGGFGGGGFGGGGFGAR